MQESLTGYLFIAPQMVGFLVFVLGPIIAVFIFSLQSRNLLTGVATFHGVGNYLRMFTKDPLFNTTIANSLVFSLGVVPLNLVLALSLALGLSGRRTGTVTYRVIVFAPVVTSAVAWAVVWRFLLQGQQGIVNHLLALLDIHGPNWLREPSWAMVSVIFTRVLKNVGMNVVIFLAAITNLPREQMEAARVDGAGAPTVLFRIKLPLLAPSILMVMILTVIGSLNVFDTIMLMTGGGPENGTMVLVYYIYYNAFQFFDTGYASALAVVLFLVVLILTFLQWQMRRVVSYYES